MATRPDACTHQDWQARATLIRLTDTDDGPVTGWTVELEMTCVLCLTPMQWLGTVVGGSGCQPNTNRTRAEIRLPCQPSDVEAAGGTT